MAFLKIFSNRLKALRQQHSVTQVTLAAAIGLSKQTINDLEHARINPSVASLIALADYFNVSLDYIVGRSDNPDLLK